MADNLIFSDRYLKSLKAQEQRYFKVEYSPHRGTGRLSIFVESTGRKTFKFQYHSKDKRHFVFIGDYKQRPNDPGISLVDARQEFARLSKLYQDLSQQGVDLRAYIEEQNRVAERELQERGQRGTFGQLLDHYVADMRSRECRTTDKVDSWFTVYVRNHFPVMLTRPANEILPEDIADILRRLHKEGSGTKTKYRKGRKPGATTQVNSVRRCLHTAFQVGVKRENDPRDLMGSGIRFGLKSNPVAGVPVVSEWDRAGDRALEFDEIVKLWPLLDSEINKVAEGLLKFCLVTGGQRHGEVLRCDRACYDFNQMILTIPASINKNKRDHVVPLTSLAVEILHDMELLAGDSEYFFPAINKEHTPYGISSLTKAVSRFCELTGFEKFIPRDIRRTAETRMSEISIPKEIRDRVQDHNLKGDVTDKHYNRYDYLKEKRAALEKWERKLRGLITGETEKIVPLRQA